METRSVLFTACAVLTLFLALGSGRAAGEPVAGMATSPREPGDLSKIPSAIPALSPGEVLEAAFVNRYSVDLVTQIELVMRDGRNRERRRTIAAVTKVVDGRVYSIGRLLSPEYLRDMTVLMMESENREQDAFVFMPSLDKVRRITTAQRSDAFFGSDITYEDIEQQRAEDFEFDGMEIGRLGEESVYRIQARPARVDNYARAVFTVAQSDFALLEILYYKRSAEAPYRIIRASREHMTVLDGHVLPTRIHVENTMRGTQTDVLLTKMRTDLEIPTRIFSVRTLESRAPLPRAR
jgi:hypothetical protein